MYALSTGRTKKSVPLSVSLTGKGTLFLVRPVVSFRNGSAVNTTEEEGESLNDLITTVFEGQPLALPGSD